MIWWAVIYWLAINTMGVGVIVGSMCPIEKKIDASSVKKDTPNNKEYSPDYFENKVGWNRNCAKFDVWYEETFCGCSENHLECFPANIFDMTPEEYKDIVEKKEQEEARRKALEREQNERQLLAKLKKKYESEEVKDIFRKAEGILLNEEDK